MSRSLQQIETIFHRAVAIPAEQRAAFLDRECQGDLELMREVESLLRSNGVDTTMFAAAIQPVASDLTANTRPDPCFSPGALLGPYRIERKLGEGGMGEVYLGTDTRLGRNVAIKFVSRTLARTPEAQSRFLREARSAAALAHTNIAAVFDVGETAGTLWLVMEHVNGTTLRSRMGGPLPEASWRRYASELAAAPEHAHTRGIIHRDIKPENILITEDDHIKVIDFGLARAAHDQSPAEATITEPNAFVGTIAYAAPELLTGASASPRSDVYSAGLVLYGMACGEPPFKGLAGQHLISAILSGAWLSCKRKNPHLPKRIAELIEHCLMRNPADRYKSAAALASALRDTDATVSSTRVPEAPALAVVDFKRIGGDHNAGWLGTGIAETLSGPKTRR